MNQIVLLKTFTVFTFVSICFGYNDGVIALTKSDKNSNGLSDILSKEELVSIYSAAKNVSYSKGTIIKSKAGEHEYRRSFISKVESQVNYLQLQHSIFAIKGNISQAVFNKSLILEDLYYLESLVHQYEIGKKFVDLNGFELILSLTMNKDDDISNAAFLILSAALQGNLEVQKYGMTTELLNIISKTLHPPLPIRVNGALLTLSAFIRNYHEALKAFLLDKGMNNLSYILANHSYATKIHLRIVDIISDISVELFNENLSPAMFQLRRVFVADIQSHNICARIAEIFSTSEKYATLEKLISVLNAVFEICKDTFQQRQLSRELKILMKQYDPFNNVKIWYMPTIDVELKYYMFQNLKVLYRKLHTFETNHQNLNIKYSNEEL